MFNATFVSVHTTMGRHQFSLCIWIPNQEANLNLNFILPGKFCFEFWIWRREADLNFNSLLDGGKLFVAGWNMLQMMVDQISKRSLELVFMVWEYMENVLLHVIDFYCQCYLQLQADVWGVVQDLILKKKKKMWKTCQWDYSNGETGGLHSKPFVHENILQFADIQGSVHRKTV